MLATDRRQILLVCNELPRQLGGKHRRLLLHYDIRLLGLLQHLTASVDKSIAGGRRLAWLRLCLIRVITENRLHKAIDVDSSVGHT